MSAPYLRQTAEGVVMHVRVQPNARRNEVAGLHGRELKVRLQAPPVEGKANAALVEFVAGLVNAPRSSIEIIRGETARSKQVLVRGQTVEQLLALNLDARR